MAQTVRPLVTKTLSALSHWLAPRYGEDVQIEADEQQSEHEAHA